jgi:hypothetical protein
MRLGDQAKLKSVLNIKLMHILCDRFRRSAGNEVGLPARAPGQGD